jgi:NDP-4-keto-2,6-dideoxyhexose 3-C-methyltransferase
MRMEALRYCRICASSQFRELFDLGRLRSCSVFPRQNEADPPAAPLDLIQCAACGLVQLSHDFAGDDLFRSTYGYRSGLNESMVSHLGSIAASVQRRIALEPGDVVLDIGSNDGTLLSLYSLPNIVRIGIDPTIARFRKYYSPGVLTLDEFFTEKNFRSLCPSAPARVITSISMFYDLPSPNDFVRDIASILATDGIWVLEQSYLPSMVDRNSFDTVCHEHLEYYCLRQIIDLAARHGLRIFDVSLNDINGGSFQVWVCHADASYPSNTESISRLAKAEERLGYSSGKPILDLKARVTSVRDDVLEFLTNARRQGKLVHGYGASTKGNTLLQFFGITPELLPAIAERNEEKFGCRTPGSGIPIISEEESRALRPDYYFVLPWHFRNAFLQRESEFIARGGRFVFPLPNLDIVPANPKVVPAAT